MGAAIIWVISYHFFGQMVQAGIKEVFFAIGNGGVDIFLFLSGLGLMFSYYKNPEIKYQEYIKKRFIRIIPTYYIVIVFFGIFLNLPFVEIIEQLLIFGFFLPMFKISFYDWYIPSLLVFYLIFPVYYKFFIKNPKMITLAAIVIGTLSVIPFIYLQKGTVILFFSRIPVFFIGAYFGYLMLKGVKLTKSQTYWVVVSFIVWLVFEIIVTCSYNSSFLRKTALSHLPFMFITPGLCLILSYIFDKIHKNIFGLGLLRALKFCGILSLEIYLIHMSFYHYMKYIPVPISLLLTIVPAYLLNFLVEKALKNITGKNVPA